MHKIALSSKNQSFGEKHTHTPIHIHKYTYRHLHTYAHTRIHAYRCTKFKFNQKKLKLNKMPTSSKNRIRKFVPNRRKLNRAKGIVYETFFFYFFPFNILVVALLSIWFWLFLDLWVFIWSNVSYLFFDCVHNRNVNVSLTYCMTMVDRILIAHILVAKQFCMNMKCSKLRFHRDQNEFFMETFDRANNKKGDGMTIYSTEPNERVLNWRFCALVFPSSFVYYT